MKISEMIKKLEEYKKELGDVDMGIMGSDYWGNAEECEDFYIKPESDHYIISGCDLREVC